MYEDFLSNPKTYESLERRLTEVFQESISQEGIAPSRFNTPLYNTSFYNGMPFMDGNPIFSAKDIIKKRALRIIIEDRTDKFSTYTASCEHGTETVLIGGIGDLNKIENHIRNWCSS